MERVLPNAQLLATERTEMVITALKMLGRTLIPASSIAMTNGEAFVFAPEAWRRFSLSAGTTSPRMKRPTM